MAYPPFNRATAQPLVYRQSVRSWKDLKISRQRISENEPCRASFSLLEVFEKPAVEGTSNAPRNSRLAEGQRCLKVDLAHLTLTGAQQACGCLDQLAELRLDGHFNSFRHEICDQIANRRIVLDAGYDSIPFIPSP